MKFSKAFIKKTYLKILSAKFHPFCWGLNMLTAQIDGLVQDCSNSIANALELLQSCTKPSKYTPCISTFHLISLNHQEHMIDMKRM